MKRLFILSTLAFLHVLMSACGNFHTIEVRLLQDRESGYVLAPDPRLQEILDETAEITGYQIVPVEYSKLDLQFIDSNGYVRGRTNQRGLCRFNVWSNYEPVLLAHEMGHVLGLEHSDDINNLMHPSGRRPFLTDKQRRKMRAHAKNLETWCWDSSEPQERSGHLGPHSGDEPVELCTQPTLGAGEAAEPGLGGEQEAATGGVSPSEDWILDGSSSG